MVVGWMGNQFLNQLVIKTRVSFDAGQTWSNTTSIPHIHPAYGAADPSIAFDRNGNVYVSYIDFSTALDSGSVLLRKSTDGGLTWGAATEAIGMHSDPGKRAIDRPWMVVDQSTGAASGNVYISSMNLGIGLPVSPPYNPYISRSTDGGQSFLPWKFLDAPNWETGSLLKSPMPTPTVGVNGVLHIAYPAWVINHNPYPRFILASSSDGGNTFSYQNIFYTQGNANDPDAKKAYLLRSNPADSNHLVFIYIGAESGDSDVMMVESSDGGANWSSPLRINDDPIGNNRVQDMVWADFDTDGDLIVSWRDRRNGSDSTYYTASEIMAAVRPANASTFQANFSITDSLLAYDTILAYSGNDFMCIKLRDDTLNAVWGDARSGRLNIWFQRMSMNGALLSRVLVNREDQVLLFPNPSHGEVQIQGEKLQSVRIFNAAGQLIQQMKGFDGREIQPVNMRDYPKGLYFFEIETEQGRETRKFIKN